MDICSPTTIVSPFTEVSLTARTALSIYPRDDWASGVELYANDITIQHKDGSQWNEIELDGVTRYIANGVYVNVPSVNLAYVFGCGRVRLQFRSIIWYAVAVR